MKIGNSYGAFFFIILYLPQNEGVKLQLLNTRFYKKFESLFRSIDINRDVIAYFSTYFSRGIVLYSTPFKHELVETEENFSVGTSMIVTENNRVFICGGLTYKTFELLTKEKKLVKRATFRNGIYFANLADIKSGDYVILTGGYIEQTSSSNLCMAYSVMEDKWETLQPITHYRKGHTSFCIDNFLYLVGGNSYYMNFNRFIETYVERMDTDNIYQSSWEALQIKNESSYSLGQFPGSLVLDENRVLIFGGTLDNKSESNSCIELNLKTLSFDKTDTFLSYGTQFKYNFHKKINGLYHYINYKGGFILTNGKKFEKLEFDEIKYYKKRYMNNSKALGEEKSGRKLKCDIQ